MRLSANRHGTPPCPRFPFQQSERGWRNGWRSAPAGRSGQAGSVLPGGGEQGTAAPAGGAGFAWYGPHLCDGTVDGVTEGHARRWPEGFRTFALTVSAFVRDLSCASPRIVTELRIARGSCRDRDQSLHGGPGPGRGP